MESLPGLGTLLDYQLDLKRAIIDTNKIIQRWKVINNVSLYNIDDDEIKSIFFGYFRKLVNSYTGNWRNFQRIKRVISIKSNNERFISNIVYGDTNLIYDYRTKELLLAFDKIDYNKLIEEAKVEFNSNNVEVIKIESNLEELNQIKSNLDKISNIKF